MGGPAPWAHIPSRDRRVTLSDITTAFSRSRTPQLVGTVSEGIGHSAVLCLLYERADDVYMVLTRRSPRLRHHAHEVAFPGGRRESGDADLWTTAVREAQEEVGIDPSTIRRIGELDSFVTVGSRTLVTPFVAVTDQKPTLKRDPIEVELIRHVSFRELLLDEVWREEFWLLPQFDEPRERSPFLNWLATLSGVPPERCSVNCWPLPREWMTQPRLRLSSGECGCGELTSGGN